MHSWYKTRLHPSELTAGFNNNVNRDGYEAVAEMFARNSCKMILPGMDLSDKHQPQKSLSSPESILAQIRTVCRKHEVEISGQNSVVSKALHGFEQIKKNISGVGDLLLIASLQVMAISLDELLSHGDRLLSLASTSFSDTFVTVHGKIPLMHSWYKTRSHPSELTAGFNNNVNRDGYEAVAGMFARNSCKMILLGMDLSDKHQPQESLSSPESILAQIRTVCRKHGVKISGQNSVVSKAPHGFEQIKKNISGG
ncbi:hypothetical protein D5086_022369 [Populus alba]|uniref:Uncharacterized protein n=1 Tax=Populus alba TaxID=43335 RepID=A0ACC4BFR5_POPAL